MPKTVRRHILARGNARARFVAALAFTTSLIPASHVLAQSAAAPSSDRIETVTVTAELRKENLQNTPIAITAVHARMLQARGQTNITQVAAQAPNVTFRPAGSSAGDTLVAYIRGVGQGDFNFAMEPGVGTYIDDVYFATASGADFNLLDLDRVEILRGPQGTLAG